MVTLARETISTPSPQGIYDVPEAARYLRATSHAEELYPVSSRKLIGWIRRGLASPDLSDVEGRELLIEFEDLVSMRVVAALRAGRCELERNPSYQPMAARRTRTRETVRDRVLVDRPGATVCRMD